MSVELSDQLAQRIADYLSRQPYSDVAQLIADLVAASQEKPGKQNGWVDPAATEAPVEEK